MHKDEAARIIDAYVAAYNRFDVDGMLTHMAEDVVFRNVSGGRETARAEGVAELRALAEQGAALFSERRQAVTALHMDGDTAVADIAYSATLAVDLPGGPKAGDVLELSGRSEFVFRDGKIAALTDSS